MQRLLTNRIALDFRSTASVFLIARPAKGPAISRNKASWIKKNLPMDDQGRFSIWLESNSLDESSHLETDFQKQDFLNENMPEAFVASLDEYKAEKFSKEIFKKELARHLISKGYYIRPSKMASDLSAYQKISNFDDEYDQYRRVDFVWLPSRKELLFNFGSERTLVTKIAGVVGSETLIFDNKNFLVYRSLEEVTAKSICPPDISRQRNGAPKKFNYRERFENLKKFAEDSLYDLDSPYFFIEKSGFKYVHPNDFHSVFSDQNLLVFGNNKPAINAVIGMREYGPFRKAADSERKKLLFIYKNRDDANTLYKYLKNGLKHFPGLLSYVGIPVALAGPDKGFPYVNANTLPDELERFLSEHYPDPFYPDILAVVIGPFKRYESEEEESENYYRLKKILLQKGIASQCISPKTLRDYGVHYSLPNIAIAILAKFGGVPWKLSTKKTNELIVGFNTKLVDGDRYLGSAVFFDNEGKLGGIKGLPADDKAALIQSLRVAITDYTSHVGKPDRLIIHYYKPTSGQEIKSILNMLKDIDLSIPVAVIEVNDSKSKLEVCFDADFDMGMPQSGVFIRVGRDEYLLFNNNRYKKDPPRKIDDELPIKLKIQFLNTGGFSVQELIAQVYEFSRLNWKGLKQKSLPVTTTYAKNISEFSSYFDGNIPENEVSSRKPWFI